VYSTFCTTANSLSHLYTHTMNQQKLSIQAGECHALVCFLLLLFPLFLFSNYYLINYTHNLHCFPLTLHRLNRWSRRTTTEDSVAYHRPKSLIIWVHIVNWFTGSELVLNRTEPDWYKWFYEPNQTINLVLVWFGSYQCTPLLNFTWFHIEGFQRICT